MIIEGNFVDVLSGEVYPAKVTFSKTVQKIQRTNKSYSTYIVPGFIDSHIRFEESLLNPIEYTKLALLSGVTTVVEDCSGFMQAIGVDAFKYLSNSFKKLPIDYRFLYPLNVSKNKFESGPGDVKHDDFVSVLKSTECLGLTQIDDIKYLKEGSPKLLKRLNAAKTSNKSVISNISKIHFSDMGNLAQFGVRADLGSNVYQDAFQKACYGVKIKIVEGTKRKTLVNLIRLAKQFETTIVSEEKSAYDLSRGYLQATLKKAVSLGLDEVTAIKNVTINPAKLLGTDLGHLSEGSVANIVELEDLKNFNVKRVFYEGEAVVKAGKIAVLKKDKMKTPKYKFDLVDIDETDVAIESDSEKEIANVLRIDPENSENVLLEKQEFNVVDGHFDYASVEDVCKVVVASIYGDNVISVGFVKGFGITKGAVATNLYGSSGNLIVVGRSDVEIAQALNELKNIKGGFVVVDKKRVQSIPFEIYGVVSNKDAEELHDELKKIGSFVKRLGCKFSDPFYVLGSLMNLNKSGFRISDSGLVDVANQELVEVFVEE